MNAPAEAVRMFVEFLIDCRVMRAQVEAIRKLVKAVRAPWRP
jgi:hypothetical protein